MQHWGVCAGPHGLATHTHPHAALGRRQPLESAAREPRAKSPFGTLQGQPTSCNTRGLARRWSSSSPSSQTWLLPISCIFSPGPLPPVSVHWLGTGHPDRLSASWEAAAGGRDGYRLTLYHTRLGTVAATASVGRDTHNFTFTGLAPGCQYSLEASATAGPYQAAAPNVSGWTRECPEDCPLQRGGRGCTGQPWRGLGGLWGIWCLWRCAYPRAWVQNAGDTTQPCPHGDIP